MKTFNFIILTTLLLSTSCTKTVDLEMTYFPVQSTDRAMDKLGSYNFDIKIDNDGLILTDSFFISKMFEYLNGAYVLNPMDVWCACDCNSVEELQRYHNQNLGLYLPFFSLNEFDHSCEFITNEFLCEETNISELVQNAKSNLDSLTRLGVVSKSIVESNIYPMIIEFSENPQSFSICDYKEQYSMLGANTDSLSRITFAASILVLETSIYYYHDSFNDMFPDDGDVQGIVKGMKMLGGGYLGAIRWAVSGDIYGQSGQDCLLEGLAWGSGSSGLLSL